ncbi:MAG: septation protein IspZ [Caulobacteraceae bacterium]|nr:septation protein IspZ [Caulobacteraceae bacterium]
MKSLLHAGKFLALDMASTVFFLITYLVTRNIAVSVALGMALGAAQIGWQLKAKRPVDTMQWMSLFLVIASGTATLLTRDARFVMIKPSLIYAVVGVVMLKRGWMNRYLPPEAIRTVPDIAMVFGYLWSGLMFASAVLNLVLALRLSPAAWASFMSAWAIVSKLALFAVQYGAMRAIGVRRHRAQMALGEAPAAA